MTVMGVFNYNTRKHLREYRPLADSHAQFCQISYYFTPKLLLVSPIAKVYETRAELLQSEDIQYGIFYLRVWTLTSQKFTVKFWYGCSKSTRNLTKIGLVAVEKSQGT